ncbi:4957_t:CDS:2, partial [Cetraspora pellucida]
IVAVMALDYTFDKGIDNIEFLCQRQPNLAMLQIRARTQVIVRDKNHSSPYGGQMSILCVTRDLNAFKEFMSHFKNSENSVAKKPMESEKFKSLIRKYFDSDGNALPPGMIKNPLLKTQLLSRNTSPISRYGKGKEI